MRDAKLAAIRDGNAPSPRVVVCAPPPPHAVPLEQLESDARCAEPLERLARVVRVERGRENQPPAQTISAERASLLSFIAGEVRRR